MITVDVLLTDTASISGEVPESLHRDMEPGEVQRMQRYRNLQDRWLFAVARALLRYGLATRYGITAPCFTIGSYGRPHLACPGPDFNFAHTAGLVVCGFGVDCDVGVDCEHVGRDINGLALADCYFSQSERALLRQAADPQRAFWRLWTFKEAVAKAVGMGLTLPLADFDIALDPPRLTATCPELGPSKHWQFAECSTQSSHHIAVAVRAPALVKFVFDQVPLSTLMEWQR